MPEFSADLLDDLSHRRVALFLGSGVSASSPLQNDARMKTWDEFLTEFLPDLSGPVATTCRKFLEQERYLEACEIIKSTMDEQKWIEKCENEFQQSATHSSLHEELVRLDQRIVITTNFDKLYDNAWSQINNGNAPYPNVKKEINSEVFSSFRSSRSYLIKMHGSIDEPKSMIFSYQDYVDKAFGNASYHDFLTFLFVNYTVLFVGFSMKDPAIKSVVQSYASRFPGGRPHYMFTSEEISEEEEKLEKKFNRISIIRYSKENNHKELVDIIRRLRKEAHQKRKENLSEELLSIDSRK